MTYPLARSQRASWSANRLVHSGPMAHAARRTLTAIALVGLALGSQGCSSEGAQTDCNLSACTITFDRATDAKVSILGIEAKLVRVSGNKAQLQVGGQPVTAPVGGEAQAGDFSVSVRKITQNDVVVRVARGGG